MLTFSRNTIQGQIFRSMSVVAMAIMLLGGLSVFVILKSRSAFQATNLTLERNADYFFNLRVALDQASNNFSLIGASEGGGGLQYLEEIRNSKTKFYEILGNMERENKELDWFVDGLQDIRAQYEDVNVLGRETTLAFMEKKKEIGTARAESLQRKLGEMRESLTNLTKKARVYNEGQLFELLGWLLWGTCAVAILALVFPMLMIWRTVREINLTISRHVSSLYDFSEQNIMTSDQLKDSSESLSSASNEQSASVQETVASMAQMKSMLAQTSTHVKECQRMSQTVTDRTQDGSQIMERMESAMMAIEQSNTQLQSLEEIINGIKEKTKIINDIVFKTQLLSFNASIEAARAGQYGRGFAVVAEEVGNLAKMSGGASKEIDLLLQDSQKRVSEIVEIVRERVRDGKAVSSDALVKFGEIAKEVMSISEKINHVGEATLEQEGGIVQTSRAMDQMNETALLNKKSAEQILAIADKSKIIGGKIRNVTGGINGFVGGQFLEQPFFDPNDGESPGDSKGNSASEGAVISLIDKIAAKGARQRDFDADDRSFRKMK